MSRHFAIMSLYHAEELRGCHYVLFKDAMGLLRNRSLSVVWLSIRCLWILIVVLPGS